MRTALALLASVCLAAGCGAEALYPPRPPETPGPPVADPAPARVVVHATVSAAALKAALDQQVPVAGRGSFSLFGGQREYSWRRSPIELSFDGGRIGVKAHVFGSVTALGQAIEFPIDLQIHADPIVSSDYHARLQSVDVAVTSNDARLRLAQGLAGALDTLRDQIAAQVKGFDYDLRPFVADSYQRIVRPIDLPVGEAHGCAYLRVTSVEAGPTVLANGLEKDLAVVVAPQITLPCSAPEVPPPLPPLANVAALPGGPFTVTVPIAARYEELQKAMTMAFTDGKLFFSKEFPQLYLAQPEVYSARDQLVVKLHIAGPLQKGGIHVTLDGDLFLSGHPQVVDNELRVPDLQPTIETSSFLLKLKAALDADDIRNQAREALKLDIGARLAAVRAKLSSELAFAAGDGKGCLRAEANKIEVTGVYPHAGYLRLYVALTGQASVYLPCPADAPVAVPTAATAP